MKVIHAYPPNIDELDRVFNVRGKRGVIFTWGETIYVPDGFELTSELKAHEGVHFSRQTNDPAKIRAWWDLYLVDPAFRLAEELPAHRAEYRTFCALQRDYNARARFLHVIAARLCGPFYGGLVSHREARQRIAA